MIEEQPVVFVTTTINLFATPWQAFFAPWGWTSKLFGSTQEFLEGERPDAPACLVLDVRLPGAGGLDFQRDLADSSNQLPIIFITGHGDIP